MPQTWSKMAGRDGPGRGLRRDDNPQAKIIIRNYPLDTTERDLRIMFEKYGKIDDCKFE